MNGRPLSTRKKVQILIALTILAWATHTLLHQWGYGAEIPANSPAELPAAPAEKFVPGAIHAAPCTLELRGEASVFGGQARLRQVCRWTDADAAVFVPVADLVVARLDENTRFTAIDLAGLKAMLSDAGVNLGVIRFAGPTTCTVRRTDAREADASQTLDQWVAARRGENVQPTAPAAAPPAPIPVVIPAARPVVADPPATRTLRELLSADLSVRLSVPAEQLQVSFNPRDDNLLNLSEPQFRFNLEARRVRDLGEVEWEVTVVAGGSSRRSPVVASARAWQAQVVVNRALAWRQPIREGDLSPRRALVDRLGDDPPLTMTQALGQQAARDLKPGTVLTSRMVDPVPLATPGQLVTLTTTQGNVRIKTVARALEAGSLGQTIRVRNDTTSESYDVVLTGPQQAAVGAPPDAARLAAGRE